MRDPRVDPRPGDEWFGKFVAKRICRIAGSYVLTEESSCFNNGGKVFGGWHKSWERLSKFRRWTTSATLRKTATVISRGDEA